MNRSDVRNRAQSRCEYCKASEGFSLATFHIEHVIARQHGGGDEDENLALACPDCNFLKGPNIASIDPESGEMTRIFHPRNDVWDEHFEQVQLRIEGRTAIGRATVQLLALNTPARLRFRGLLRQLGE